MKTKKVLLSIAMVFLFAFASKAYVFQNNTNCTVVLQYEMWGSSCLSPCKFGTLTVPPGSTLVTNCPGFSGICIVITTIGGSAVAGNHAGTSSCHVITPYGQSGTIAGCTSSGNWTAFAGSSSWIIN